MVAKDILNKLTPAELISLLTKRRSPIDASKGMDKLTVGDLMVMQHNPDILEEYQKDRINLLLSNHSIIDESDTSEDDCEVGELIRELYG
ncbi:MAG: hypothetical protein ACFFDN_16995 [Candidatus Hodarchaeota archaeon]